MTAEDRAEQAMFKLLSGKRAAEKRARVEPIIESESWMDTLCIMTGTARCPHAKRLKTIRTANGASKPRPSV